MVTKVVRLVKSLFPIAPVFDDERTLGKDRILCSVTNLLVFIAAASSSSRIINSAPFGFSAYLFNTVNNLLVFSFSSAL